MDLDEESGDRVSDELDSVELFARDLRALRHTNRDLTLVSFEARTGISKSTFSAAFRGHRLPSEKTVRAIVSTLGCDPTPWLDRRAKLAATVGVENTEVAEPSESAREVDRTEPQTVSPDSAVDSAQDGPEPSASDRAPRTLRHKPKKFISRKAAMIIAAGCALITAAATSLVWGLVILPEARIADPTTSSLKDYTAHDNGVDPMLTVCREDAVVAAAEKRMDGQFFVEMIYSNQCMGAWGRVTRYDEQATGNSLKMVVYPEVQMNDPRTQTREALNLQSLYTTMLIEPNVEARVCGLATVTQDDGTTHVLNPAVCI